MIGKGIFLFLEGRSECCPSSIKSTSKMKILFIFHTYKFNKFWIVATLWQFILVCCGQTRANLLNCRLHIHLTLLWKRSSFVGQQNNKKYWTTKSSIYLRSVIYTIRCVYRQYIFCSFTQSRAMRHINTTTSYVWRNTTNFRLNITATEVSPLLK